MKTIRSSVVGMKFHAGAHDKLLQTPEGTIAELVREPTNQYDPNAIRVYIDGTMCGFIPKQRAVGLAKDIDAGGAVTAMITGYNGLVIEIAESADDAT